MLDRIIDYESGELSSDDTLSLFADLIRTGLAWTLQGSYGRTAKHLIDAGYLSTTGEVLLQDIDH